MGKFIIGGMVASFNLIVIATAYFVSEHENIVYMENSYATPFMIPIQPELFWAQIRQIIREEIKKIELKKETISVEEPLRTRKEIAAFLKISLVTLNDWMKKRGLPFHKRRRGPRFLKSEVLQWLKKSEAPELK